MEQEIINPAKTPRPTTQGFSPLGCALAAIGAGLGALTLLGAGAAASVWAIAKLIGLPNNFMLVLLALAMIPVIAAALWTTGRAWHIERRLAGGLDVDLPVFKLMHYLRRS